MNRILSTLARTVSKGAPGSVTVVMTLDGDEFRRRGTLLHEARWVRSGGADADVTFEEQVVVMRVAIPTDGLPLLPDGWKRLPENGDELFVNGMVYYATKVLDLGEIVHVHLARWRA